MRGGKHGFGAGDTREAWPTVREGCQVEGTNHLPWIPEDIYAACVNQKSVPVHGLLERNMKGASLLFARYCEFRADQQVFAWVVYDPEYGTADHYREEWEELAMKTGHDAVEFVTPSRRHRPTDEEAWVSKGIQPRTERTYRSEQWRKSRHTRRIRSVSRSSLSSATYFQSIQRRIRPIRKSIHPSCV